MRDQPASEVTMTIKKVIITTIVLIFSFQIHAREVNSTEKAMLGAGAVIWFGSELMKGHIAPAEPHWVETNSLDDGVRNSLRYSEPNMKTAALFSDILLWGVFFPAVAIVPLAGDDYSTGFQIMAEAMVLNGLVTQATKLAFGRQRPYARYETMASRGRDDNMSFFSGHTSVSFSMAAAGANLLSKLHPDQQSAIWAGAMTLAAATGYFRIAADKHYFTDVLTGAIIGTAIGYMVSESKSKTYSYPQASEKPVTVSTIVMSW